MDWDSFKPFFRPSEFECKCGCGKNEMTEVFMRTLFLMRRQASHPFIINSGFRCEEHNFNVGGSSNSAHLLGQAADIRCEISTFRYDLIKIAYQFNICRIGLSRSFIHLDIATRLPQYVIWFY